MDHLIETLQFAAIFLVTWGNLLMALWCIARGRKRGLVIGLILAWTIFSTCLFVLGFGLFGHDSNPPAYVDWIGGIWMVSGIVLFGNLFRMILPDRASASSEGHD